MSEHITPAGAGPFHVGDRVHVPAFDSQATVTAVGETNVIRAYDGSDPVGQLRAVTAYRVRLDYGIERTVMDRDGHLLAT